MYIACAAIARHTSQELSLEGHGIKGVGDLIVVGFDLG